MFELYTETARHAIFRARYEAAQAGSETIESEHLLLGIFSAGQLKHVERSELADLESIRRMIAQQRPPKKASSTSVDLPMSAESKRILTFAAEEARQLKHGHIGVDHLLLGILRVDTSFAAGLLRGMGVTAAKLREEVAQASAPGTPPAGEPEETGGPTPGARDLTRMAKSGALSPLIGRDRELERAIQILSRRTRNNVVVVGEPGVGKTALVEGIAQRIADGNVPPDLAERPVLSVDASLLTAARRRTRPGELPEGIPDRPNAIVCVEGLFDLAASGSGWTAVEALHFLDPVLARGGMRAIATGTPLGFRETTEKAGALARHFEPVTLLAPSEAEATQIVMGLKEQYERFHGVAIVDDAIAAAVQASGRFLMNRQLPDRAFDLIDEAAARLKLRRVSEPREVVELRRRIRRSTRDMETAIGAHQFDKAREHADKERQDREKLLRLLEERKAQGDPGNQVTAAEIEEVIADRTGAPVAAVRKVLQQPESGEFELIARELGAQIPVEMREWVAFLSTWLANCSPDDAERLASSIRAVKSGKAQ